MPVKRASRMFAIVEEIQPVARKALGPYRGVTAVILTGSGATIVLTPAQAQNSIIQLTGAVRTGGVRIQFPNPGPGGNGAWFVDYAGATGLNSDNAISLAVGTGVFGGQLSGGTSTLAVVVAHGANVAPAVVFGA